MKVSVDFRVLLSLFSIHKAAKTIQKINENFL